MIQLKAYENSSKSEHTYIDLYDESPIKLNFSIEDITNAQAKSVFSRTFRVPGTPNNNRYFRFAFEIGVTDFDVTIKKPAEILVDGAEFRQGYIRLQKMYRNQDQDRYDYELIFLGETRDFSASLGDSSLCQLDLGALSHVLSFANVAQSWEAYPSDIDFEGTAITPSFTNGLVGGDVIYPLVDFGNIYPLSNSNPRIAVTGSHTFLTHDLPLKRLKPMVRAKAIVDAIFDATEYSYQQGGFFDTDIFKQMYVSGWGNVSAVDVDLGASNNIFEARGTISQGSDEELEAPLVITNPGGGYNQLTWIYTAPIGGEYTFYTEALYTAREETIGLPGASLNFERRNGGVGAWVEFDPGFIGYNTILDNTTTVTLAVGDQVRVYIENHGINDGEELSDQVFQCTAAPGNVNVAAQFDCDYKQIDFIKDLLTTFRLVMAPTRDKPTEFIIEPWVDYVASGDLYDWSNKLDRSKDLIIEPLFDTQTDIIYFDHQEDKDYINEYHVDAYKYTYGHLEFDSGNELLVGSRQIKTLWAPTPITQIEGAATTGQFIIPIVHQHNDNNEHLPIKPKTRLLFYNGLQDIPNEGYHWKLEGNPNPAGQDIEYYPLVSNSNVWGMEAGGYVLNWFNDIGYWGTGVTGFPTQLGQSLYNAYWSVYIQSLYNKDARRVTGTFILNSQDLLEFSFDDIIFLDGQYYRPEKVIDAPVGNTAPVKVQLIKLLTYRPPIT